MFWACAGSFVFGVVVGVVIIAMMIAGEDN